MIRRELAIPASPEVASSRGQRPVTDAGGHGEQLGELGGVACPDVPDLVAAVEQLNWRRHVVRALRDFHGQSRCGPEREPMDEPPAQSRPSACSVHQVGQLVDATAST